MKDKITAIIYAIILPRSNPKWDIYIIIIIRNAFNKLSIDRRTGIHFTGGEERMVWEKWREWNNHLARNDG